ncbi:MAG TPA: hypothetical protein VF183_11830 [Acidimicrobiales bacterium]
MVTPGELIELMLDAPVALAAMSEHAGLLPVAFGLDEPEPSAAEVDDRIAVAVARVGRQSFGEMVAVAVEVGSLRVGPWISDAPEALRVAYGHAERLRPLAEAIVGRFFEQLVQPVQLDRQQWWTCYPADYEPHRLFENYDDVYGDGELTWAGLRTVTDPPDEAHGALVTAWELDWPPVTRWHLPVRADARVHEIRSPRDWVELIRRYPHGSRGGPDWAAIAADLDAVHLTWSGFLTTEGRTLGDAVLPLQYWFSERTLWLHDVFGDPEPLGPPVLDERFGPDYGVDVRTDAGREAFDRRVLARHLGRG